MARPRSGGVVSIGACHLLPAPVYHLDPYTSEPTPLTAAVASRFSSRSDLMIGPRAY